MESLEQDLRGNSSRVTRKLMRFLGEQFPVGREKERGNTDDPPSGNQDPLPSILKIAQQGWAVDEHSAAKRDRRVTSLPAAELSTEDVDLLQKWTPGALQEVVGETTRYFEYGLGGSKRDVAKDLDPLQRGMISDQRAQELFDAYFEYIHPQWAILDPSKHTLGLVRRQSAYLTTAILALGSIGLATLPDAPEIRVAEALRLRAHVEKLDLVVYSTGARSIEIVQARILLSRFGVSSRTRLDEQRWVRSAMIPRMAADIGLWAAGAHSRSRTSGDNNRNDSKCWNELRTRAFMILNEYRFFTFSGHCPLDMSYFELQKHEIDQISTLGTDHPSASLPALYHLYLFQTEVRRRLDSLGPSTPSSILQLQADLSWVAHYISQWIVAWCSTTSYPPARWHLLHDALSVQLLSTRIIERLPQTQTSRSDHQRYLLIIAIRIFEAALDNERGTHMTHRASIFPFAGALILRFSDRRDLVLRLALRMAGDPGGDANHARSLASGSGSLESEHKQTQGIYKGLEEKNSVPQNVSQSFPGALPASTDGEAPAHLSAVPFPSGHNVFHDPTLVHSYHDSPLNGSSEGVPAQKHEDILAASTSTGLSAPNIHCLEVSTMEIDIAGTATSLPASHGDVPNNWISSQFHSNSDPPLEGADWFNLDTPWEFPLPSAILNREAPFLTSHELIADVEVMETGLLSTETYVDPAQDKRDSSFAPPGDMNASSSEGYLGVLPYPDPSPAQTLGLGASGGSGANAIFADLGKSSSQAWAGLPCLNGNGSSHSDGGQAPRDRDRDGYRETLFLTINRLLEMASAA
ncbi:hypothetical protein BJX66DRAFT_343207 [Aspergillus keveii]|uniref:Transcription factor domain-containing protein n=1 Tax=Aspergillus keveii TaxID=714993 RepID=A0ABR4FQ21_9EURO